MTSNTNTPDYLAARREWMERYGSYIAAARNWRLAAFASLAIAAGGVAGTIHEASKTHVVPYVVEVDKLGDSVRLAQAVNAGALQQPIVTHVLANWVTRARERVTDNLAQKRLIDKTYRYVDQKMEVGLDEYYKKHNPFSGSTDGARTVTITSALPEGTVKPAGGTYEIDWTEQQYDLTGRLVSTQNWKAIITYAVLPVTNAKDAETNPFGIYVTSFQWQKTL